MRKFLVLSLAFCCAPAALADNAALPDLFKTALNSGADASAPISYTGSVKQISDPDWGELKYTVIHTADGKSATIESLPDEIAEDTSEEDILSELADPEEDIWCDGFDDQIGSDVKLVSEDTQTATFEYMANPDTAGDKHEAKILKHTQITVDVDKSHQTVTRFHYKLQKPVKPMMVAKVENFEMIGSCETLPTGRAYVARLETKVSGSAMMQPFDQHTVQEFTHLP